MKHLVAALLGSAVLLCGCASPNNDANADRQDSADRGTTTLGSLIPRKSGSHPGNVANVDKQALENDRAMNSNNINGINSR